MTNPLPGSYSAGKIYNVPLHTENETINAVQNIGQMHTEKKKKETRPSFYTKLQNKFNND